MTQKNSALCTSVALAPSVTLAVDEEAMVRALRYAFTNHDTVVQELLQNARRAGARSVDVWHDPQRQELVVRDDGVGIADFQALLTIGRSGWSPQTCNDEQPYGVGFMSALYAATRVQVRSISGSLVFDTDRALAKQPLSIDPNVRTDTGCEVTLTGFDWLGGAQDRLAAMCRGFELPVSFNGDDIPREHALGQTTTAALQTHVGTLILGESPSAKTVVYLQGFRVYPQATDWSGATANVLHLDGRRYRGRLPDRDKVVDEELMLDEAAAAIHAGWEQRLESMRSKLSEIDFCRLGHPIARALHRLELFNDIPVVPQEWLKVYSKPPRSQFEWENSPMEPAEVPGGVLRRDDVISRSVHIADIDSFWEVSPENEAVSVNAQAQLAWALRALVISEALDRGHWLFKHAAIHSDLEVTWRALGERRRDTTDTRSTHEQWGREIVLVDSIELQAGDLNASVTGEILWHDNAYWVACGGSSIVPSFVTETVQQGASYTNDFRDNQDDAGQDASTLNQILRKMLAKSPEDEIASALQAAIRDFADLRNLHCRISISAAGHVEVSELRHQTDGLLLEAAP